MKMTHEKSGGKGNINEQIWTWKTDNSGTKMREKNRFPVVVVVVVAVTSF